MYGINEVTKTNEMKNFKPFNEIAKVKSKELVKIVSYCNDEVMIQFEDGKLQAIYKTQLKEAQITLVNLYQK